MAEYVYIYIYIYGDKEFFNLICHSRKQKYTEKFKGNQITRKGNPITKLDCRRGPSSAYNNLLNALTSVKNVFLTTGEMKIDGKFGKDGPFLAIDIINCSDKFENDAFECGKIPGWVNLMSQRKIIDKVPFLNRYVGKERYL